MSLFNGLFYADYQEHERSAGLWHSVWQAFENITELTLGSLDKSIQLIGNLEIHPERMMENLEALFSPGESIRCCEEIVSEILADYASYENQL